MKGIGKEFMEKTKYRFLDASPQSRGEPQPPLELPPEPGKPTIPLPNIGEFKPPQLSLHEAISKRRSLREYSDEPLTLGELGYLLWACQGVERVLDKRATLRTVPSAGARHCFETYVLANRVQGVQPGIYRYLALSHRLQEVKLGPGLGGEVAAACLNQGFIKKSAATLVFTAHLPRMYWRYGERGYRYIHLDAGHAMQNLYLAAESMGAGACAVAAFDDDELNGLLGLDGEERFAVYVGAVGKRL